MTVIVSGAAGFVGSHLIRGLVEKGEKVIGIDNFNDYYSPELKRMRISSLIPENTEIVELDLTDKSRLSNLFTKIKPTGPVPSLNISMASGFCRIPSDIERRSLSP
jgi:UDP-glucuronate 4-epimerase